MQITIRTEQGQDRTFEATKNEGHWILEGKRGAVYGAIPFVDNADRMHVMGLGANPRPLGNVTLVEIDGQLVQEPARGEMVRCAAGDCIAAFLYVPERAFPRLCIEHGDEAARDREAAWNPMTSVD